MHQICNILLYMPLVFQLHYITLKLWIYEKHKCELRSEELSEGRASQLYTQLMQLRKESLKKKIFFSGFLFATAWVAYTTLMLFLQIITLKVAKNQCNIHVLSFMYWLLCCRSQAKATIGFSYDNSGGVGNSDKEDDDDDSDSDSVLSDIGKKLFLIFEHHHLFDYRQWNCWWQVLSGELLV